MKSRWFNTGLWGASVALSWMWGLGLFFSVQFTHQFGLFGLLTFAIPNALGLILFGLATQIIANRGKGSEALASFFTTWSRPFRLIFFLYQILAITLTIFAIIRYVWQPLHLEPSALYLPLTILIVLASGCLFGEEFDIKRIKISHGIMFLLVLAGVAILCAHIWTSGIPKVAVSPAVTHDIKFWGYAIPLCIGLLLGPWLDLQQWQRAIQMQRENLSVAKCYLVGGILFFLMLLFHGTLASWAMERGSLEFVQVGWFDKISYAQGMLTEFFYRQLHERPWVFGAYALFVTICILSTLDSGYIALRWFLTQNVKASKSALFSLIPEWLIVSPIPWFVFSGVVTLFAVVVKLELEYFMIFYATFFVGYAALAVARCFIPSQGGNALPQIKMFCIGSLAVVIFAYGYFLKVPFFQILGSMLPLGYIIWLLVKPGSSSEFVTDTDKLSEPATLEDAPIMTRTVAPAASADATEVAPVAATPIATGSAQSCYFQDKWFIHTFMATYADTNSVGNVYFGMYAMWVGKTRELFFNKCLPKFNIKTTPYYILTRSFEHKFLRETHEFEQVSVRIRVAKFNRKFATLEHEVYDSSQKLLGHGEQSLMFVSSSDYKLIDIPQEVHQAFIAYT